MSKAKCNRCGGSAEASTFKEASEKINHAVGLSRGRPCGDSYGCVVELVDISKVETPKVEKPKVKPKVVVPKESTKHLDK